MEQITAAILLKFTEGNPSSNYNLGGFISQVTLDSRNVASNCLFVAIRGEHFDGHDYVARVVADKSNYALVNKDFVLDLPNVIRVEDTTLALGVLAANYRQQFDLPVVAITGSNGKTTVKEMLREVCKKEFGDEHVLATKGNLNNHLGMPLTLLELDSQHKVAIIEMGMNHSGELDYLTKLAQPTIAVVNNVKFAHAGHFSGLDDIAAAKAEIYHGLIDNGIACVDVSNEFASNWVKNDIYTANIFFYGSHDSKCWIEQINLTSATYQTPLGSITISLQILGQHNYINALTVIALAINIGCSLESIKFGLENYAGYYGRLERKTAFNGALIIDDTYNANPDSVEAALEAIQVLPRPHWFIFADLKELGSNEVQFHHKIGELANLHKIDKFLTVGNLAKYALDSFSGEKINFANNADVVKYCISNLPSDAILLVKGSNSMRLFDVVAKLVDGNQ